jgi:GNAT superfamily N-acetyltransferase
MTETTPVASIPSLQTVAAKPPWHVRNAAHEDTTSIVVAVAELLVELGATPPCTAVMEDATRTLLNDPVLGAVFVAEADGGLVGVLAASWQSAIHVPGPYALIQNLWVSPEWRSSQIGTALVAELSVLAHKRGIVRIEVGLPKESFSGLATTEAFYRANGFKALGPRMRMVLA